MSERKAVRLDAGALWEYAVKALANRAHSIGELRAKLRLKACTQADVDAGLARRKEYKSSIRMEPPRAELSMNDTPFRGAADARVTVVEFADYE